MNEYLYVQRCWVVSAHREILLSAKETVYALLMGQM